MPGFEVEVIGTDAHVDRRLPSVAEAEVPYYAGLKVGVPSLPAVVEALSEGRYDLLHLCTPGPAGIAAALTGRLLGLPTAGSYHTELAAYAGLRSGDARLKLRTDLALAAFYGQCDVVLSPSTAHATTGSARSASRRSGSRAGTAASTSPASRPSAACRGCSTPRASTSSTRGG